MQSGGETDVDAYGSEGLVFVEGDKDVFREVFDVIDDRGMFVDVKLLNDSKRVDAGHEPVNVQAFAPTHE